LTGGPVGPASRWAATSFDVNGEGRDGGERRERGTKSRRGKDGIERRWGSYIAMEGGLYVGHMCRGPPETADGPVCLVSHGQFKEPLRPCIYLNAHISEKSELIGLYF